MSTRPWRRCARIRGYGIEPTNFFFGSVNVPGGRRGRPGPEKGDERAGARTSWATTTADALLFDAMERRPTPGLRRRRREGEIPRLGPAWGLGAGLGMGGAFRADGLPDGAISQLVSNRRAAAPSPAPAPKGLAAPSPSRAHRACPRCAARLAAMGACPFCGASLTSGCPHCGAELAADARFYPNAASRSRGCARAARRSPPMRPSAPVR